MAATAAIDADHGKNDCSDIAQIDVVQDGLVKEVQLEFLLAFQGPQAAEAVRLLAMVDTVLVLGIPLRKQTNQSQYFLEDFELGLLIGHRHDFLVARDGRGRRAARGR